MTKAFMTRGKSLGRGLGALVLIVALFASPAAAQSESSGAEGAWGAGAALVSLVYAPTKLVYAIGGISGCHINPAISVAMWVAGKLKSKDAIMYIIFQCVGATIAAGSQRWNGMSAALPVPNA